MLRLLLCTAAFVPVAILPWFSNEAEAIDDTSIAPNYVSTITDPQLSALRNCETGELPIFFHDDLITTHSAEFIDSGLAAVENCGAVEVTIIPVLPEQSDGGDIAQSVVRMAELSEVIRVSGQQSHISNDIIEDEVTTLYINGRAAILRIDP